LFEFELSQILLMTTNEQEGRRTPHRPTLLATMIITAILLLLSDPYRIASSSSADDIPAAPASLARVGVTCASHPSCADCYAASHACHLYGACHAKGAVRLGCLAGASYVPADAVESTSCTNHATYV
jgi:hypothetical protein